VNEQAQIRIPAEDAFRALLPEMDALAEAELSIPTVDIMSAVSIVLGVWPRLQALRPEIERQLPHFNLARFDQLELYAKALHHANALFRMATSPKQGLADRANELTAIRDRLLTDARSLANYGLLDGESLKECKTALGYKALASDIAVLLTVFKERWPAIKQRTPVTVELLNDANDRAEELLEAVAVKDQAPVTAGEAGERRRRAFTVFARAYKDAQRAVAYLRADFDDAEQLAPSIFTNRPKRRTDESDEAPGRVEPSSASGRGTSVGSASNESATAARNGRVNITVDPNGLPITPPLVG
jgi:hypothetical protein